MKKFLSLVSLLLVAMMILAMPTVSAEETQSAENAEFTLPAGINKYYANDVSEKTPIIDGVIEEGEYGKLTVRIDNPSAMKNDGGVFATDPVDETLRSTYIEFWFAYDENNYYIAIHDAGPEYVDNGDEYTKNDVPFRNNVMVRMGFDLNDLVSYFWFAGSSTVVHWNDLRYMEFNKSNVAPVKTGTFITEAVVRKVDVETGENIALGDFYSSNGNLNYAGGKWEEYIEFKIDKKATAIAMNECFYTDYQEIPNAMYFSYLTNTFRAKADSFEDVNTQYYLWLGNNDISDKQGDYESFGYYEGMTNQVLLDLIVFGDENTVVTPTDPFPVIEGTEASTTEPVTEAPVEETEAVADETTNAPAVVTDGAVDNDGGCGGSITVVGLSLVAALGTCTAFLAKKREDNE